MGVSISIRKFLLPSAIEFYLLINNKMSFIPLTYRFLFILFYVLLINFIVFKICYSYSDSNQSEYVTFHDVHYKSGISSTGYLGHSALWADFDNDSCLDLFATNTNMRKPPRTYLYRNLCNGKFQNIVKNSGISDFFMFRSSSAADYDNDGNLDLVLGGIDVYGLPTLYQNIGENNFIDVTELANIDGVGYVGNIIWADYNLDGYIDLVQVGSFIYLYKNLGNGTFNEVSFDSGLFEFSKTNSSIWIDYNNDSYPDLFLANKGYNALFHNNGDGTFTNVTFEANLHGKKEWKTVAACTGDYNNDGYFDLYLVNLSSDGKALYKNNGDGTFTDVTGNSGTADVGDGRTCSFIDYNSDGLMDIFTTNHIKPSKLFKNNGDGTFTNMSFTLGIDRPIDAFSATWGDFNGDAMLDVFLNGHIGIALYEGFNLNNSVVIELVGDGINTNTSAIGSRVDLTTDNINQTKEVSGGKGCCEQDMLPLHFGLGKETQFNMVVNWTSGKSCKFENQNADDKKYYKIWEEGCKIFSY